MAKNQFDRELLDFTDLMHEAIRTGVEKGGIMSSQTLYYHFKAWLYQHGIDGGTDGPFGVPDGEPPQDEIDDKDTPCP